MHTTRYMRALALAALLGVLVGGVASCAPSGTATPTSPPTAVSPAAGTLTPVPPTAVAAAAGTVAPSPTIVPSPTALPTETPTTAPTAVPTVAAMCSVGERCEGSGMALTVNDVSTTDVIDSYEHPEAGSTFLVVDVTIEDVSRSSGSYNPLDFRVRAADGTEYTTTISTPSPQLHSGSMTPGEKVRGNVAFEVPLTETGLTLLWEPTFAGPLIRVSLGR